LQEGDLVLTEGGDPDKLGRGYIWNGEIDVCIHQNHIFRVRLDQHKVLPMYLAGLMRTAYAKHYFLKAAKRTSNLASINMTQLKAFLVPVPTLDLQRLYVTSAETLLADLAKKQQGLQLADVLFHSALSRAFTGELTAEWEREHADLITAEVARLERRPRLALLALVAHRRRRREEPVGITSLMKYAFLAQMQGAAFEQANQRLYQFVPYHYGPFAQELYDDLAALEVEGWLTVARPEGELTTHERIDITLNPARAAELPAALADLSDAERAALAAVIERYGDLSHNDLLAAVYEAYPEYARKSRLRRKK
jgi:type I restriction enzyme S subunit